MYRQGWRPMGRMMVVYTRDGITIMRVVAARYHHHHHHHHHHHRDHYFLKPHLQPQTGLSLSLVSIFPPVASMASILHSSGLSTTVVELHPLVNPNMRMYVQCSICGIRQWANLPSDSAHRKRFCVAEGPPARCERCCRCFICRLRTDVHNFLHATDNNSNNTTGGCGPPICQ